MRLPSTRLFFRIFIGFSIVLSLLAFYQNYRQIQALGIILSWQSKWIILFAGYVLNILLGIWLLAGPLRNEKNDAFDRLEPQPAGPFWRILGAFLVISGFFVIWFVRLKIFHELLPQAFPSFWLFWWCSLLAALGIKLIGRSSWLYAFVAILLLQGVLFALYSNLQSVSDYPFSIGYSEGSRYYYGSLPFSQSIYSVKLPLSIWHPTRYLLLAIPFVFPGSSLEFARLWQAVLWIGLTAGSAYALVWRLHLNRLLGILIAAWFFIYSFQGAVYYHLHVMVIIIMLGVSARHPWRSLVAVLLASFWAGMSRVNWFPVPAMLAIALYLLEEPFDSYPNWSQYLKQPVIWGILGMITAFLSQAYYIVWSGNSSHPEFFSTSFTSDLLWNRLLPSPTYSLGILPGIFMVSLPIWLVIYFSIKDGMENVHWLRWLGLGLLTLILFVGGLVVSTKIGGGGDLHNMDAYMVILATIAAYLFGNQVAAEKNGSISWGRTSWAVIALALTVPLLFSISNLGPYSSYNRAVVEEDMQTLRQVVFEAPKNNGQVLFITERQLLTYHNIDNVPIVSDYEVVTLMEMAMSHGTAYLNQFYADLHKHRFALIIARKQNYRIQSSDQAFADENNAWNTKIATQLLCDYEPVATLKSANVQVFAPRPGKPNCP